MTKWLAEVLHLEHVALFLPLTYTLVMGVFFFFGKGKKSKELYKSLSLSGFLLYFLLQELASTLSSISMSLVDHYYFSMAPVDLNKKAVVSALRQVISHLR